VLDDSRLGPPEVLRVNLVFLNIYADGQAYTEQDYRTWLSDAGFERIERIVQAGGSSLFRASKAR